MYVLMYLACVATGGVCTCCVLAGGCCCRVWLSGVCRLSLLVVSGSAGVVEHGYGGGLRPATVVSRAMRCGDSPIPPLIARNPTSLPSIAIVPII